MGFIFVQAQTAYITNQNSNDVTVIDVAQDTVITTIPVGQSPFGLAVNPNGTLVYVVDEASNDVDVISTSTNTVIDTIEVGNDPECLAITPDGTRGYVANFGERNVMVFDAANNTVFDTIVVGDNPGPIVASPLGTEIYVGNYGDTTVMVISTATNTVTDTIHTGPLPCGLAVTPDGTKVYVTDEAMNAVSVIDVATKTVTDTIAVSSTPKAAVVTPDGSTLYVSDNGANEVSVIDVATNMIITTIPVGTSPIGISVSPDGSKVLVANSVSDNVSVISTATNTVTATVPVGSAPIAFGSFISVYPNVPASSLDFDGVNDHVILPTGFAQNFVGGKMTGAAWVYLDENTTWATIIKNWGNANWGAFHFGIEIDSLELAIEIQDGAGVRHFIISPDSFPLNEWVHTAFTAGGDSVRLYENGVQKAVKAYDGKLFTDFPATYIGAKPNDAGDGVDPFNPGYWNGRIDELSLWNRALTQAEIQELASCAPTPGSSGLVAYYNFNQGVANADNTADSVLTDESGNAFNGDLTNFALTGSESNWADGNVLPMCTLTTSIEEFFEVQADITLAPNPVIDRLNVILEAKQPTAANIYVFDMSGKMVQVETTQLRQGAQSIELDVNQLSSGLYFLTIQVDGDHYSKKFVKVGY